MKTPERYRMDRTEKRQMGERLKAARRAAGFSSAQAACEVGLTHRNTVIGHESGYITPTIAVFAALCRLYGVSMDEVWFGNSKN